jgi:hypothetical protein
MMVSLGERLQPGGLAEEGESDAFRHQAGDAGGVALIHINPTAL